MSLAPPLKKKLVFRPAPATGYAIEGDTLIFTGIIPRLSGATEDTLAHGDQFERLPDGALLRGPGTLAGVLMAPPHLPIGPATELLYTRLLDLTAGQHLHRIWNLVPHINAEVDGLENYRAFNAGRHRLLSTRWGTPLVGRVPAASALGTPGGVAALAFSASEVRPVHFENPLQAPAVHYPPDFGALPPAFARASRVDQPWGSTWHLSGTASVRGSRTEGSSIQAQLALTLENIASLCAHMEVPARRCASWKIFLRHPEHLGDAAAAFREAYPGDMATAMFLHAEICRADLLVEIEGQLSVATGHHE